MITAWAERTVIPTVVQWLDHFRVQSLDLMCSYIVGSAQRGQLTLLGFSAMVCVPMTTPQHLTIQGLGLEPRPGTRSLFMSGSCFPAMQPPANNFPFVNFSVYFCRSLYLLSMTSKCGHIPGLILFLFSIMMSRKVKSGLKALNTICVLMVLEFLSLAPSLWLLLWALDLYLQLLSCLKFLT